LARQARDLREWFRRFVQRHAGKGMTPAALDELDRLNRLAAADSRYQQISKAAAGRGERRLHPLQVVEQRRWDSPERLLQPLVEAMIDLVCNVDFKLIRTCEGAHCTLTFHDTTRGHARRWCSMAVCGNRHKAAAHRERQRQ
jgi:predicted RNA-binding Zn ribbon-like protein